MSFFVDAQEQRERARRAEQRLLEHDAIRTPRPPTRSDEADEYADYRPPPVFLRDGAYQQSRETSVERRAVRFRDGLPPPEPEVAPQNIQRVLPPPPVPLQDQQVFDQNRGALPITSISVSRSPSPDELSQSQKKRLRRKRNRDERRQSVPAPYPLPQDRTNGQALDLPPPTPRNPETRESCEAEVSCLLPDGRVERMICRLTPFPHPNQPHLVQLRDADGTPEKSAEIFVGFWLPGE